MSDSSKLYADDSVQSLNDTIRLAFTIACVLVSFSFFLVLYRVAQRPRHILPSEKTYETMKNGKVVRDLSLTSINDEAEVYVSVIIPAFNETKRITVMLQEALDHLNTAFAGETWEILIIDDGSTDETTSIVQQWVLKQIQENSLKDGQVRICSLEINRGKGGAVTHGMLHHRGKYAIFADADGASQFSDISILLEHVKRIERNGLGIAGGSRAHMVSTDAVVKRSPLRNLLMHGFHTFIRLLGVSHIKDTQCGFKLFTRGACRKIFPVMHIERYAFDVEIFLIAEMLAVPVIEVPITWHEVEGSKMNLVKDSLNMAWDLILMRIGYTTGIWALEAAKHKQQS